MEVKLRFSFVESSGKVRSTGDARTIIGEEDIRINPMMGEALVIPLRDIAWLTAGDYRIDLTLRSAEILTFFNLGYQYEDFTRQIFRSKNELELKDLMMDERLLKQGVRCECSLSRGGARRELGKCEARLYQTAMVIMPENADLIRARYADLKSAEVTDFKISLRMEDEDLLEIGRLGTELDPLRKGLSDAASDISAQAQRMVKDAFPSADSAGVLRASKLLRDGRAASKRELDESCPGLWDGLEKKLAGYGIGEEFRFLSGMSKGNEVLIGMKRPLHTEKDQDYVFFLAPIYSLDGGKGGNAVAFEASSGEDEGRATYFFRIWGRSQYPLASEELMHQEARRFVDSLAQGLNVINFRREPIYLPEERLYAQEHSRYRYAVMRIPQLRLMRERFIGRVMHSSLDQWREDVIALLSFNVAQREDMAKWKKAEEGQ